MRLLKDTAIRIFLTMADEGILQQFVKSSNAIAKSIVQDAEKCK